MKPFALLILLFAGLLTPSTDNNTLQGNTWSRDELQMANTAKTATYLSGEEKDLVMYMNLARLDGEKFFNTYFQEFANSYNRQMTKYSNYKELRIDRNSHYYISLERDLKQVKNLDMLYPDEALSWVSRQHAKDMNKYNYAAHTSRDGRSVKDRIYSMYPKKSLGENLAFGYPTGLGNVCMLLLDKGVSDLGHRKIILNSSSKFNFVGVSIQPHKGYRYCSVTDFVALPR
ncbi:CAP domain-containing protein [Pedobacter frigoris]|uniref:CAP domain-containing protein n=1 Tax=Pedobacter frigoris TaxID=2571272 RepID=A0A4U1CLN2_9SPHI|nr:CAP domain-containing protein [Pedobacter frigoris]TKC08731.1 CAP domain-containing protein [Pedobacter frigoris]